MRKLATVQTISDIQPIPDADRIEVVTILGWKVVIRKGEFNVGDKCIYFEIDSIIPIEPWSQFLEDKNKPGQPVRLRTVKLRKQISQGLAVPFEILENYVGARYKTFDVGADVTEVIGITKYEPPIPAHLAGQVRGIFPALIPKTDETRIQSEPDLIDEFHGEETAWTIKMDGTSGTFANIEGDHHVCSRNLSLKDDGKNTYWAMYHKYNLKEVLDDAGDFAIQGEVCGEGIQKNRMGLKGQDLFVFNVYDIRANRFLGFYEFIDFCERYNLQTVPVHQVVIFSCPSVDALVEEACECHYPNGALGEGYVIRPVVERYSNVLRSRASFKVINNKYLTKHGE
jgi:RNA ligase (TIGR02306 family)